MTRDLRDWEMSGPDDDSWLGIPVSPDERPKSGAILLYAGIALLLFGLVGLWLVMGQR